MSPKRNGFTLIEMVIAVVLVGLLAAISIPRFTGSREKSVVATMMSDLHNLAMFQEDYLLDSTTYYAGTIPGAGFDYQPSRGVTVILQNVTAFGWAATTTHQATTRSCAFYMGPAGPVPPATVEGIPGCN